MNFPRNLLHATMLLASVTLVGCVTIKGSSATPEEARAEYLRTSTQITLAQGVADRCAGYAFNADASNMLYGLASDLADREFVTAAPNCGVRHRQRLQTLLHCNRGLATPVCAIRCLCGWPMGPLTQHC